MIDWRSNASTYRRRCKQWTKTFRVNAGNNKSIVLQRLPSTDSQVTTVKMFKNYDSLHLLNCVYRRNRLWLFWRVSIVNSKLLFLLFFLDADKDIRRVATFSNGNIREMSHANLLHCIQFALSHCCQNLNMMPKPFYYTLRHLHSKACTKFSDLNTNRIKVFNKQKKIQNILFFF